MDARASQLEFAAFRLDRLRRQLRTRDGSVVPLSSRAFETLLALVERPGQVLSKRELLQTVWPSVVVEENNLTQAISALRKALGDTQATPQIIQTVPGRGYCFVAELRAVPAEVAPEPPLAPTSDTSFQPQASPRWHALLAVAALGIAGAVALWMYSGDAGKPAPDLARLAPEPADTSATQGRQPLPSSVAALPFTTVGGGPDGNAFVAGLHEEVLTQLSRVSGLKVISRSAVLRYRNDTRAATEIARELNVGAVLEGHVRSVGPQLRINLQLSDATTRVALWSASYDASLNDVKGLFSVQADIASNVAKALAVELMPRERLLAAQVPTESPLAYQHYLKGLAAISANNFVGAVASMEEAVKLDPDFADAWRRLALNHNIITATPVTTPQQHHERALFAAKKAVMLAPESGNAHYALGNVLYSEGKWEEARNEFAAGRKLERTPLSAIDAQILGQEVMMLMATGDFDAALQTQQRELHLNPMQSMVRSFTVLIHEYRGDHELAMQEFARGKALLPTWWGNNPGIWIALGQHDSEHLDNAVRDFPDYILRNVLVLHTNPVAATAELRRMHRGMDTFTPGQQLNAAMFAAYFGQQDMSMDFLETALRDNGASFYTIWLPVFKDLRQTERFKTMLRKAGLVDYWQRHGWPAMCTASAKDFSCH